MPLIKFVCFGCGNDRPCVLQYNAQDWNENSAPLPDGCAFNNYKDDVKWERCKHV